MSDGITKNYLVLSNRDILTTPSAPIINSIIAGDSKATIFYSEPLYNGGAIITKYTANVYQLNNPIKFVEVSVTNPLSNIIITGLTNGTTYNIKLVATNSEGESQESSPMSVTPISVPDAPTINSCTAGDGQVSVSFTAPMSNGGSTITNYTVKVYNNIGILVNPAITTSGVKSPIIVSGLTNGIGYRFTVIAENEVGSSQESIMSAIITPMAPQNPICYIGESKVLVQNKETGIKSDIRVKDITPEKYLVYSTTQQKFVEIKNNCISGQTDKFILIKKDLFGENKPSEDFYVTPTHPILVNNCEIKAKNIIGAQKVTLEKQHVYSLVTENREALAINNIDVMCWEYNNFMKAYKKRKNAIWIDNKNIIIQK
jgi:hypothetical protein